MGMETKRPYSLSPEGREKLIAAGKKSQQYITPEDRSAAARKGWEALKLRREIENKRRQEEIERLRQENRHKEANQLDLVNRRSTLYPEGHPSHES